MARWLKQSTSVDVPIGPFVDQTDGFTAEVALTLTQPDIRLKKNAAAWAQKAAAQTLTHEENGYYEVTLDATDTNTLGLLRLAVIEVGALPIWEDFLVVPANVYDSIFSTDFLQVDATQLLGTAIATPTVAGVPEVDITHWLGAGAPAAPATQTSVNTIDDFLDTEIAAIMARLSVASGTSDSGTTTTMVDAARTEADADYWKGNFILFTSGTITGQCRLITGFTPATDTITFAPATTQAVGTQTYEIIPAGRVDLQLWQGAAPNALVSSRLDASVGAVAADAITDAAVAADMDSYACKVWVVKESTTSDHYGVGFFKNGQPVLSGITSPTIQVIKASDGTDLIASTALTQIGSTGLYKKDEATNKMTAGAMYFAKIQATIDGATRTHTQQVGRDSV